MKTRLIPFAIKYYLPWLSIIKKKLNFLLNKKNISIKKPPNANASYCYSVWSRHFSILNKYGLNTNRSIVAEFGPGDSIGVGLLALLAGAKEYYALDVEKRTRLEDNLTLLDEIIELLLKQMDIPNEEKVPSIHPLLDPCGFQSKITTEERVVSDFYKKRIQDIKDGLLHHETVNNKLNPSIHYLCPWYGSTKIKKESVDMFFSHTVLEHVTDLGEAYKSMYFWLKNGGVMSHYVDFKSHGITAEWNGHWAYSDFEWKLIKCHHIKPINREPLSTHIDLLNKTGFKILDIIPIHTYSSEKYTHSIQRQQLAKRFKIMSEKDFITCSAHIISIKD